MANVVAYLWEKDKQFKNWVKRNGWRGIAVELAIGLSLVLSLYFFGRKNYMKTLDSGKNCFSKTDSIFIDKSAGYLDQVGFKFTDYKGQLYIGRYPKDIRISKFDFSRTYTTRYLCDRPKYKELILEDWDESKYKKDSKGRVVLKD